MPTEINGYISDSNYYSFDGSNENFVQAGGKFNFGLTTVQMSCGADINTNNKQETTMQPVFELKGNYNLGDGYSVYGRIRDFVGTKDSSQSEQYRIGLNKNIKTGVECLSFYMSSHATVKHSNNGWKPNFGGWIGASYRYKNISTYVEFQQNVKPNQESTLKLAENRMINVGINYTF